MSRNLNRTSNTGRYKKTTKKRSIVKMLFIALFVVFIVVAGIGFGFIGATMQTLPNVNDVKPAASSEVYDVHGELITTIHSTENRIPVKLSETPKNLQNAFIAAEDSRFYSHHGIDPKGILRALWVNITHQGVAEGGSTITQQLARNAFLTQDQTIKRKVKEALLAIKIEQTYTKPEILEMYMNQIYFGQGAYGVEAASRTYFGKDVKSLNLAQAALLAGLPNSPNYLNPFHNLKGAKERQAIVLDQMAKYGYISQAESDKAKEVDLQLTKMTKVGTTNSIYSYFLDYIIQQVSDKYGADAVYKGGLKIYTTIDKKAQEAAVKAMDILPTYYTDKKGIAQPQGALIAINPHNGYIVAMVGGRGTDFFNRTVLAQRQPGSAFKPFVYLTAIQAGMTPGTILKDQKVTYGEYTPQNYERTYSGDMTLRYALQHSVNTIAVQLADKVGMKNVINNAKEMGISTLVTDGSHSDLNLAAALGGLTNGVTPIDIASAYGVLANGGVRVKPVAITKIIDRNGQVIEENTIQEKRVVSAKDAYILTNMLESVIQGGTGGNAYLGRPAAGKTGTTDDSKDAWFIGYTPNLSCAVWMGDDYGAETLHGLTGGTIPAEIWRRFMTGALEGTAVVDFPIPPGAAAIANTGHEKPKSQLDKEKDKDKNKDKDKEKNNDDKDDKDKNDNDKNSKGESNNPIKKVLKKLNDI